MNGELIDLENLMMKLHDLQSNVEGAESEVEYCQTCLQDAEYNLTEAINERDDANAALLNFESEYGDMIPR